MGPVPDMCKIRRFPNKRRPTSAAAASFSHVMWWFRGAILGLGLWLWGSFFGCAAIGATESDENLRLLDGMRSRRLYSLATEFAREQRQRSELSEAEQAEWFIQSMRLLSEKGWHQPSDLRAATWKEAHAIGRQFLENYPSHSRRVLVQLQEALLWRTEAEVLQQEAELDRSGDASWEPALERLREAARRLEDIERDVNQSVQRIRPGTEPPDGLTADELYSLASHVRLHLARVYRIRGECYPAGSDDRFAAATQALQTLQELLAQVDSDDALAWEGRVEQLIVYRLAENFSEAGRLRERLEDEEIPDSIRVRIHAEAARVILAERSARSGGAADSAPPAWLAEALRWVELAPSPSQPGAPHLDLARLEVFIAAWKARAEGDEQQAEWRQRTVSLAKYIEQSHGRYWARRADQLLLREVQGNVQAADAEILRRQADDLYLRGELEEALTLYDEVVKGALEGNDEEETFRASYRAGLVQVKRGEDHDALDRLRRVSRDYAAHESAPAAHLAAIQSTVRLARTDASYLELYEELLREHIRRWPRSMYVSRVNLWLGRLQRHQQRWRGAIEAFQRVSATGPEGEPALEGLEASWRGLLSDRQAKSNGSNDLQAFDTILDEAIQSLRGFSLRVDVEPTSDRRGRRGPDISTPPLRGQTILAASRLLLEFAPHRAGEVEDVLHQYVSADSEENSATWRSEAESWLFLARALQPERQDLARQQLRQLEARSSKTIWRLLDQLAKVGETAERPLRRQLASLQLELLQRLESLEAEGVDRAAEIPRRRARALWELGEGEQAIELYRRLVDEQPRDGVLQTEYAQLLAARDDPESLAQALRQWRVIADRTPPHGDAWYAAKYQVAELLWRTGRGEEAAKLIRYLRITSPLPTSDWSDRFEELLKKCTS